MGAVPTSVTRVVPLAKSSSGSALPPASHDVYHPMGAPPRLRPDPEGSEPSPLPPNLPKLLMAPIEAKRDASTNDGGVRDDSNNLTARSFNSHDVTTVRSNVTSFRSEVPTVRVFDACTLSDCYSLTGDACMFDQTEMTLSCTRGPHGGVTSFAIEEDTVLMQTLTLGRTLDSPGAVIGKCKSWTRGEALGSGALGTVCSALDHQTGQIFAVKEVLIHAPDADDMKFKEALEQEISIMQHLKHPHIVRYLGHDYIETHSSLYIYIEYMPGGSVAKVLSQFGAFDESLIAVYARELLEGLEYLHTRHPPVVHRDIKGANVLVGIDCKVKLSDFGCSKRKTETMLHTMKGSVPWMAPEVIGCTGYGRAADIWSFGCLLVEMATGKSPWGGFDNMMAACVRIAMSDDTPPMPETLSSVCKDFIDSCLRREPLVRPSASELLLHELVHELDEWGKERRDVIGYLNTVPNYNTIRDLIPNYLD